MITKRTAPRFDALDRELFETMIVSPSFVVYRRRLIAELERARIDCETREEACAIHRAQGSVRGLRIALGLPEEILKEMRAKASK